MASDVWGAYSRLQEKLSETQQVDDRSWGLEEGLNRLLDGGENRTPEEDAERVAQAASRRERHQALLRRLHLTVEDGAGDYSDAADGGHRPVLTRQRALSALAELEDRLDSRHRLRLVEKRVTPAELEVLHAIGEGREYDDVARAVRVRAGTLRVRVQRLRLALVALVA